jgi:hypothetical protein
MVILLDCMHTRRVLTVLELLTLMDAEEPMPDGNYMDAYSDLNDFGLEDAFDVYSLEECFLATFGYLGREGARWLCQYTRNKVLVPLDLVKAISELSVEEFDLLVDEGRIMEWQASVQPGSIEEQPGSVEELPGSVEELPGSVEELPGKVKIEETDEVEGDDVEEVEDADGGTTENEDEGDVAYTYASSHEV